MEQFYGRLPADNTIVTISVDEGVIRAIGHVSKRDPAVDATATPYVSPSFIDLQVNGFHGKDYSSPELSEGDIREIVAIMARSGATRHLPTIITNPRGLICRNLSVIAEVLNASEELAQRIPGVHVEGPFISPDEGSRGTHDPRHIRNPSIEEYREWQEASGGRVKIVTLAPERPGALDLMEQMREDGVVVAVGHTSASPEEIRRAVSAGARIATHLGNGTPALLPRHENTVWSQLAEDQLTASIIADGYHLPPAILKTIFRVKGLERLVLVSDVSMPGGMHVGRHKWGDMVVQVYEDGHIGLADTEYLAGAGHLLDTCIARMVGDTEATLEQALILCTVNPARLLGVEIPELAVGRPADLVFFDCHRGDDRIHVERTISAGETVFEATVAQSSMKD